MKKSSRYFISFFIWFWGCLFFTSEATAQTFSDFASTGAAVTSLKFFEAGNDLPSADAREFGTSFSKTASRYIYYQLSLEHGYLSDQVDFTLTARLYKSNGTLYGEFEHSSYILSSWTTSWHVNGWGWENPGNWPVDTYTVKLFYGSEEIASGDFSIVNEELVTGLDPPDGISVVDATDNPASAPVYMGNIVNGEEATLSGKMELSVNFPAYNRPVDIWIAIALPDGRFYVVDESSNLLSLESVGLVPLATGASGIKTTKQIVAPFETGSAGTAFAPWPADGKWVVYWLIAPDSNGDITVAMENGDYELGYYSFNVKSEGNGQSTEINITDYFPQSGPAGSYIFLKLKSPIPDSEALTVIYDQKALDKNSVIKRGDDTLQLTIPEDARSGDIQIVSGDLLSNAVPFSVISSVTTPLVSQSVTPSSGDQVVSYNDEISVTIPSGVLDTTRTLSISKVENGPVNSTAPFAPAYTFDVSIDGLEQLNSYIEIKVKYNPDLLNPDYPAEDQLMPMRWNEEEKFWLPLPYQVDTANQTLSFYTDHLTLMEWVVIGTVAVATIPVTWAGEKLLNDVYVTPGGNFRLLYSRSAIEADITLEDTGWSTTTYPTPLYPIASYQTSHPKFIQDMGNLLESALKQYVDIYKFKDPITEPGWLWGTSKNPITIKIDSWWVSLGGDPNYEKVWENIHFPTDALKDFSKFTSYATIGHELFHRVQAEYYGIVGFKTPHNLWWLEALAEYAGNRAAWQGKQLDNLHEKTGSDFLSYPISKTGKMENRNGWSLNQSYEYAASSFIQFLVEKKGLNFKEMVEHVAQGSPLYRPLAKLNGYSSLILAQCYRDFAAWGIFGDDSFLKKYKISEISEQNDNITVDESAGVKISFTGGNFSTINIYRSDKEYERSSEVPSAERTIGKDESHEMDVNNGDHLYLLATNSGEEDETLYVSVTQIVNGEEKGGTVHTFNLKGGYSGKLWTVKITADSGSGWHLMSAREAVYSPYMPNPNMYGNTFSITSSQDDLFTSWIYPDEEMVVNSRLTYRFGAQSTPGRVETVINWTDTIYPESGKRDVDMKLSIIREWLPNPFPETLKPGESIEITESVSARIEPDPKTLGDYLSFTPKVTGITTTSVNGERLRSEDANSFTYTHINMEDSEESLPTRTLSWRVPDGVSGDQLAISFVGSDSGSAGLGYTSGSYMDKFQSAGVLLIYEFR